MKFGARLTRKQSSDGSVGSGALHALKKAGFSLRRRNPEPIEYVSCKVELDATLKSLEKLLETGEASRKAWKEVVRCKVEFGERFTGGVGEGDGGSGSETAVVVGDGIGAQGGIGVVLVAEGCRGFEREVGGMMGDEGVAAGGLKEVAMYIEVLKEIQSKYKIVAKAKSEYEFYSKKLKGLQGKAGKEESLAKTKDKFELSKGLFKGYVDCMVRMIKCALAKKETAFQGLFDAHYLLQAKMVRIMSTYESQIHTRAAADEPVLAQLSLCSGLDSPSAKFDDITTRCQAVVNKQGIIKHQQQVVRRPNVIANRPPQLITAPPERQEPPPPPMPPYAPAEFISHPAEAQMMPSAPTESVLALGPR